MPQKTNSLFQEYKKISVPKRLKTLSYKKRILLAGIVILAGAFTHSKLFNSSAVPVNERDSKKVVVCAYSTFLNRYPDRGGLNYWQDRYQRTNYDPSDIAKGLLYSREGQFVAYTTGFEKFIDRMYESCLQRRAPKADQTSWLAYHKSGMSKEEIFNFIVRLGDKNFKFPEEQKCKTYSQGGSVTPLCKIGSAGSYSDVAIVTIAGTNIVVNKAWQSGITNFRNSALKAGFNLQAYRDPNVPARFKSPGSYRSPELQQWLTNNGYPTATGRPSMHLWGLAVDFSCNGIPLARNAGCLSWVKNNASKFGLYNNTGEAWHYSTNGG